MGNPCKRLKQQVFIPKQVQSVERLALRSVHKEEEETATVWQTTAFRRDNQYSFCRMFAQR